MDSGQALARIAAPCWHLPASRARPMSRAQQSREADLSISMYEASVPVFSQYARCAGECARQGRGQHHGAQDRPGGDPVNGRLAPDMLPLTNAGADRHRPRQGRDVAAGRPRRAELRRQRTDFRRAAGAHRQDDATISAASAAADFDGSEDRAIQHQVGRRASCNFTGAQLSPALRAAQLLFSRDDGLRHPASQWRAAVEDGFSRRVSKREPARPVSRQWPGNLVMSRLA